MIDRAGRDRLANAVIQYVDHRSHSRAFDRIRSDYENSDDSSLADVAVSLWMIHDDITDAPFRGSAESRAALKCWIAFLRSEDELGLESPDPRSRFLAGMILALFAVGIAAVFVLGIPPLWIAPWWIALAIPAGVLRAFDSARERKLYERYPYAPYRSRGQWEARAFLVDDVSFEGGSDGSRVFHCPLVDGAIAAFLFVVWYPLYLIGRTLHGSQSISLVQS